MTHWIWQQNGWPALTWDMPQLAAPLRACVETQARLLGRVGAIDRAGNAQNELDALLQNIVTSTAIEGEELNVGSVRSSLARRLGLEQTGRTTRRSEGLAELLIDATQHQDTPLTLARLLQWHHLLFVDDDTILPRRIRFGELRGHEPMQVVSGRIDKPVVHFEAPPRNGLENQLDAFLEWFDRTRDDPHLDPLLRAGIAHFWFVTLHPFDDGNGRLTRAITDLALAQGDSQAIRFYAMSASILDDRAGYYRTLESTQKDGLDITIWLQWFLITLLSSLEQALARIDRVLAKSRFWQSRRDNALSADQIKVLNRMLDGMLLGDKLGFENGISASQYQAVTRVSKATATRHLTDLVEKGCMSRLPGGGRNTRYALVLER